MFNNIFVKWLREMVQRLFAKSPTFFKWWKIIWSAVDALTGLPPFVNYMLAFLSIKLPPWALTFENKFIAALSTGALFMTLMTAKSEPVSLDKKGDINKQTDAKALPFTAVMENKDAVKKDLKISD